MEMNFKDGIILPTKALRKCGPYLEKYFGITLGYFNVELEKFRYEGSASYAIQKDQDIYFPLRNLNFKAYLQDVDGPMLPIPLGDVALLVAYIIMDRKYPEAAYPESLDSDDREWDDIYQNDWSKLLVFIDEILQREEKAKKSHNTSLFTEATGDTDGLSGRSIFPQTSPLFTASGRLGFWKRTGFLAIQLRTASYARPAISTSFALRR